MGKEEKGEFVFFLIFLDILCLFVVYMSTLNGTFYRVGPTTLLICGYGCFCLFYFEYFRSDLIILDNFTVQMKRMANAGCFPRRKRAVIVRCYLTFSSSIFPRVQSFPVSIPPATKPPLLRQMNMGSLTCAQIRVRALHTKGGQAQTSLHRS